MDKLEKAIQASEASHDGEIRFVVEAGLDGWPMFQGQSARERAIDVFSQLRVWDTRNNNGLLIYLLLADRAVEIVADRGIDAKVGAQEWALIARQMETAFRQAKFEGGMLGGLAAMTQHLVRHFPSDPQSGNELPDRPLAL